MNFDLAVDEIGRTDVVMVNMLLEEVTFQAEHVLVETGTHVTDEQLSLEPVANDVVVAQLEAEIATLVTSVFHERGIHAR